MNGEGRTASTSWRRRRSVEVTGCGRISDVGFERCFGSWALLERHLQAGPVAAKLIVLEVAVHDGSRCPLIRSFRPASGGTGWTGTIMEFTWTWEGFLAPGNITMLTNQFGFHAHMKVLEVIPLREQVTLRACTSKCSRSALPSCWLPTDEPSSQSGPWR
jgi:hypothetical protein